MSQNYTRKNYTRKNYTRCNYFLMNYLFLSLRLMPLLLFILSISHTHVQVLDLKAALVASRVEAAALREVVDGMAAELHEV